MPLATQAMAARIYAEVMNSDESSRQAVQIFSREGIENILQENQYGIGPRNAILDGRVPLANQIQRLHGCIWKAWMPP